MAGEYLRARLCADVFSFLWSKLLGGELLGPSSKRGVNVVKTARRFPTAATPACDPTSNERGLSNRCACLGVCPLVLLIRYFPDDYSCSAIFPFHVHVPFGVFFDEMSLQLLPSFKFGHQL